MDGRPKELELETKAGQDDELWVEEVISYTYSCSLDGYTAAATGGASLRCSSRGVQR